MRILQICNKPPFPPKDGGCIAINNLTQGILQQGHEVKVLAISTPKHTLDPLSLPEEYLKNTKIETVFIDTSVKIIPAFFNLFTNKSYNINRFHSPVFEDLIKDCLQKNSFDIIQIESLYVTPYLPVLRKYSRAKIILRAHNVEHKIWERLAAKTTNTLKRKYLQLLAKRLKHYEEDNINSYDGIATITAEDAVYFRKMKCIKPIIHIPFGIDISLYKTTPSINPKKSVFFIGSLDWAPNKEGLMWFIEKVWPLVIEKFPDIHLHIAGRNTPSEIKNLSVKNLEVSGEVDDSQNFISSHGIMVVPLFAGGGVRVKIIEGMALGKTIISTSIGAEGINYTEGKNLLIADNEQDFARKITHCLQNESFYERIGSNARELIFEHYDNNRISSTLIRFYSQL